jgi:hypothetical protein
MTKNTWMSVPAGALGQGSADARPFGGFVAGTAAQPPFAVRQGTGLPTARLRDFGYGPVEGVGVLGAAVTGNAPCTPRGEFIAQHDGTTLGFHTSSRPLS